ncbi:MAG: DUF1203 domain-containing protein [Rhodobacteraceae bacterium]|nr:DUF1203 domain-containing protein [Paracoccaceae bacterium]
MGGRSSSRRPCPAGCHPARAGARCPPGEVSDGRAPSARPARPLPGPAPAPPVRGRAVCAPIAQGPGRGGALRALASSDNRDGERFRCNPSSKRWSARRSRSCAPPILTTSADCLLKGYTADHRILYGTGRVVRREEVATHAAGLLADPRLGFVDARPARNNGFQLRIRRA